MLSVWVCCVGLFQGGEESVIGLELLKCSKGRMPGQRVSWVLRARNIVNGNVLPGTVWGL